MNKFNNGNGAVICDVCGKIIREGEPSWNQFDICTDCLHEPSVVDNFENIEKFLHFDDENTFYWVQIIKRRKDNPNMHGDYVCYKDYCIYSYEELLKCKEDMIKISKCHNARVVIWINRRDIKELGLKIASMSLEYMQSKQYKALHEVFAHTCGKNHKIGISKRYIVDIDYKEPGYINTIVNAIKDCAPEDFEFEGILPTLHGFHVICTGFNLGKFNDIIHMSHLEHVDVHKDNPTVLYFCPQ